MSRQYEKTFNLIVGLKEEIEKTTKSLAENEKKLENLKLKQATSADRTGTVKFEIGETTAVVNGLKDKLQSKKQLLLIAEKELNELGEALKNSDFTKIWEEMDGFAQERVKVAKKMEKVVAEFQVLAKSYVDLGLELLRRAPEKDDISSHLAPLTTFMSENQILILMKKSGFDWIKIPKQAHELPEFQDLIKEVHSWIFKYRNSLNEMKEKINKEKDQNLFT